MIRGDVNEAGLIEGERIEIEMTMKASLKEEEGIENLTTVLPFAMHAFFVFEYLTYHFFYDFYLVCGDRSIRVSFLEQQKKLTIHLLYQFLAIW